MTIIKKTKRHEQIGIPLSSEEKKKIKAAAAKLGMTISSYCRFKLVYSEEKDNE